jgi:hypothetical protein
MKTFLRALILLLIVLWLGGVMFFPVVAATAFTSLPDTHAAGTIVGKCLRILHYEGLFAGTLLIVLLLAAHRVGAYRRNVSFPAIFAFVMLALTSFSQFWIIPKMEGYRIAAGGAIDAVAADDPSRIAFNKLHIVSERVEEGVLLAGIVLVALVARD